MMDTITIKLERRGDEGWTWSLESPIGNAKDDIPTPILITLFGLGECIKATAKMVEKSCDLPKKS